MCHNIMIQVDISNVWGEISLPDLLMLEKEVFDAHNTLTEGTGAGSDFRGWLDLPVRETTEEIRRIQISTYEGNSLNPCNIMRRCTDGLRK